MAKSEWFGLEKSAGVGFERPDPKDVIKFRSPSLNWLFSGGIARGYSAVFWSPPRMGKSVIIWDAIAELQSRDATARVILFDTEFRSSLQQGGATSKGVDMSRVLIKATNDPIEIFDFIEKDVPAAIDEGLNLPLIAIDSLSMIRGLKSLNADSVGQHLIGDQAQTLQNAFQRIIPVIRRKKIALLCAAQARAEMDISQQRMHKTIKMASSFGVKHLIEYFVQVAAVEASAGKIYDESMTDGDDKALMTGNRIRVTMNESSAGGRGRTAMVTLDYKKGFIDLGQEVTNLALNLGVIHKPEGGNSIVWKDIKHRGFDAFAAFLETNVEVRNEIVAEIMQKTKGEE